MKFSRKKYKLILLVSLLLALLTALAWLLVLKKWAGVILLLPAIMYITRRLYSLVAQTDAIVMDFIESVKYGEYGRKYPLKKVAAAMIPLVEGLNSVNEKMLSISRHKAAESAYLRKILEMVDIGILSFETETGAVQELNGAFQNITGIPYIRNIEALQKRNAELWQIIINLKPGQSEVIVLERGLLHEKVLANATVFITGNKKQKLVAFQNVNDALDENESKAWQKLLHVMTHEIMNSVAPIASLADTLKTEVSATGGGISIDREDLVLGLDTIKKRSQGLQQFAVTFRNLNTITKPNIRKLFIRELFEGIQLLMQPTLDLKNIELNIVLKDPYLELNADKSLLEQVLINLITNAIDALKEKADAQIILSAVAEQEKIRIRVADNGMGIPDVISGQIFIPFFSTRKNGNGIGLSLCKQIMLLHKGSIHVQSREGAGAVFVLQFTPGA